MKNRQHYRTTSDNRYFFSVKKLKIQWSRIDQSVVMMYYNDKIYVLGKSSKKAHRLKEKS